MRILTIGAILLIISMTAGCQNDRPKAQPAGADMHALTRSENQKIATVGTLTPVVLFPDKPMPTGVAVALSGRIFVNFPRWGDPVEFTVAEIKDGKPVPFPDLAINKLDQSKPAETF